MEDFRGENCAAEVVHQGEVHRGSGGGDRAARAGAAEAVDAGDSGG